MAFRKRVLLCPNDPSFRAFALFQMNSSLNINILFRRYLIPGVSEANIIFQRISKCNFLRHFSLHKHLANSTNVSTRFEQDARFLREQQLMDYSIIIGVQRVEEAGRGARVPSELPPRAADR